MKIAEYKGKLSGSVRSAIIAHGINEWRRIFSESTTSLQRFVLLSVLFKVPTRLQSRNTLTPCGLARVSRHSLAV